MAAEDTLKAGYRFFSITRPDAVANTKGIMVNTAGEYLEKCATNNILKGMLVLSNPCMVAAGDLNYANTGKLAIVMHKTQPQNILSYDAQLVLTELKAKEMYSTKPRYPGQGEWNKDGSNVLLPSGSVQ